MGKRMAADVLELMSDGRDHTAAEIAQRTGLTTKQAGNAMARLARLGELERGARGVYYVPPTHNVHTPMPNTPTDMNAWMRGTTVTDQDPVLDTIAYVWGKVFDITMTGEQVRMALTIADGLGR